MAAPGYPIRQVTGDKLSTPDELFAKVKRANEAGQLARIPVPELGLLYHRFHTYAPGVGTPDQQA